MQIKSRNTKFFFYPILELDLFLSKKQRGKEKIEEYMILIIQLKN